MGEAKTGLRFKVKGIGCHEMKANDGRKGKEKTKMIEVVIYRGKDKNIEMETREDDAGDR